MTIGQALVVGALYVAVLVGLILEFRSWRQTTDDTGDNGADWSCEADFINHGEG